jgi:hypothetical protein
MHTAKILFSNLDERLYIGDMAPLALQKPLPAPQRRARRSARPR